MELISGHRDDKEKLLGQAEFSVPALDAARVRNQLNRILADDLFHKSKRYSDLLRYIVERTLDGKIEDLRERTIGHEVFGRAADYDVAIDPTVRVVMAEVRKRLSLYYRDSRSEDEVLIELPLGGYGAEFHTFATGALPFMDEPVPEAILFQEEVKGDTANTEGVVSISRRNLWRLLWLSAAVLLIVAIAFTYQKFYGPSRALNQFWQPLTRRSSKLTIYVGSVISENIGSPPQASSTQRGPGRSSTVLSDFYVDVAMLDVRVGQMLAFFLHDKGSDALIRPARGTKFEDISSGPALLIGLNNDWLTKLTADLPYSLKQEENMIYIRDAANPSNRQWRREISKPSSDSSWDYALVSRIHDSTTGNWWIGLAGLTGAGTVRAQEFLLSSKSMSELPAHLPKNWESKNLQIVFAIRLVQGSPGSAQIAAARSW